jgi:predicted O-methyltransferase YrrM
LGEPDTTRPQVKRLWAGLLRRPQVKRLWAGLLGHGDEILSAWNHERDVRDLEQDKDFQFSKEAANDIGGWLADVEGALLYSLAKKCNANGVIVEIGSWKGRSTVFLAKGSKAGQRVKVYAIDPHEGNAQVLVENPTFHEFKKNMANAQVEDIVVPIVKTSEEAANDFLEPCALIFVDGSHEPDSVKQDFVLWYPKLTEGGIIAFHDTLGWVGPRMLVKDVLYKSNNFKNVRFARSITYGEKVAQNTMADRMKNRYFLLFNDIVALYFSCFVKIVRFGDRLGERI